MQKVNYCPKLPLLFKYESNTITSALEQTKLMYHKSSGFLVATNFVTDFHMSRIAWARLTDLLSPREVASR